MEAQQIIYPPLLKRKLEQSPIFAQQFHALDSTWQQEIIDIFADDNRVFPATYDSVFKHVFDPKLHPERLSRFLSLLLKQKITIVTPLPNETYKDSYYSKGVILDILVQLEDGSLADVEMQQVAFDFPMHRAAVHSARLLNQQYQTVRAQKREEVPYTDVRKVYTIIFFAENVSVFRKLPNTYLHHAKHRTDEGMELPLLQEYLFVELKKFEALTSQIDTEEQAWLKLLMAKDLDVLTELGTNFTSLQNPVKDVILFSKETKEGSHMIWEEDEYMVKDYIMKLQKKSDALAQERDAEKAKADAATRALSILRLHIAGYTPEQISQELSLSLEEVKNTLDHSTN